MVKFTTITVPDCSSNTHRWIKFVSGQRCVICGVEVIVSKLRLEADV